MVLIAIFAALFACSRQFGVAGFLGAVVVGSCAAVTLATRRNFCLIFVLVIVAWTATAIALAAWGCGWGALGIAILYGPSVSGLAALVGVIYVAIRRADDDNFKWGRALSVVTVSPLVSTAAIFGAVGIMPLHGC